MTQEAREKTVSKIHSLSQDKLEESMHVLAHVAGREHEMGDYAEEHELREIINLEMDEIFWRRVAKL